MISPDQYRTGYIHLSKTGQRRAERFDDQIPTEMPELLPKALQALEAAFPGSLTRMVDASGLQAEMFEHVSGLALPVEKTPDDNIVPINLWKSSI